MLSIVHRDGIGVEDELISFLTNLHIYNYFTR
jgi:hypothetical protein